MNATPLIELDHWPLVYFRMPEQIPDHDAAQHIDMLQSVLARKQPFVLMISGAEQPRQSGEFLRRYKAWSRDCTAQLKAYCRGAVRVEPDDTKRNSLWHKAQLYMAQKMAPYPYSVVATDEEAHSQANAWLTGKA